MLVGVPLLFERLPLQDGLQPPQQVGADQRVGAAWTSGTLTGTKLSVTELW